MKKLTVSVVVTTKNEEKVVGRLLKSLKDQISVSTEEIVVDNSSEDQTVKAASEYTDKVYNFGPERSAQRNFGASKARGKYLLFLDADMQLNKDVVKKCVEKAETDKKIGAIVIPEKSVAKTFWEKVKAFERTFYNLQGDETTDAARFFSKKAFDKAKGYDETITGPEDWDLPETVKKLGYKIDRVSTTLRHYERIPSLMSLAKKKYYYGLKSHRYLAKQNISVVSPKTIYFLRPVFYKNYKKLLANPFLSIAMFLMLTVELLSGGIGYIMGRVRYG